MTEQRLHEIEAELLSQVPRAIQRPRRFILRIVLLGLLCLAIGGVPAYAVAIWPRLLSLVWGAAPGYARVFFISLALFMEAISAIVLWAAVCMFLMAVSAARKCRRLARLGTAAVGTITGEVVKKGRHGDDYCLEYTFAPSGGTSQSITGVWEAEQSELTPRSVVTRSPCYSIPSTRPRTVSTHT